MRDFVADAEIMTSQLLHHPLLSSCISHCLVELTLYEYKNCPNIIDLDCLSVMHRLKKLDVHALYGVSTVWLSKGHISSLTSLESFSFQGRIVQGPVLAALGVLPSLTRLVFPNSLEGTRSFGSMRFSSLAELQVEVSDDDLERPFSLNMSQPFTSLCKLCLESCVLISHPTPFRCLLNLKIVEFRICEFESWNWLSDALEGATQVSELMLVNLALDSLPQSVCSMTGLTELNLEYSHFTTLPDALVQLSCLKSLELSENQLTVFPDVLSHMTQLRHLNMGYCSANMQIQMPLTFLTTFTDLWSFHLSRRNKWDSVSMFHLGLTTEAVEDAVRHGVLREMPVLRW